MAQNGDQKEKHKFLFVTQEALSADLAWQLAKEGHDVKFYCHDLPEKDVGDGFFEKVDDWEKYKDWADVILFDDVGFGSKADQLRKEGKFVVGGSSYTDKLELDREFGQSELENSGVNTLPSQNFESFDEAIKFVKANPDKYVIKPSGEIQDEKELLFVGQEEDGKDVVQVLDHYKDTWSKKMKSFLIQKYADGVEVAVGAFFNSRDFVLPINVNFEHKKLFPNEIGPSTGEMGCYDDKTEVLTNNGWKLFKDLVVNDRICTLNPENDAIEFHVPEAVVSFKHHDKLVSIKNRALDIMVTPDHNMYVQSQQDARKRRNNFKFVKAKDLESQSLIKRTGIWTGRSLKYFTLPAIEASIYEGRQVTVQKTSDIVLPMYLWMSFLGIWLADGYTLQASPGYGVGIAQKTPGKTEKIENLLSQLPFDFKKRGDVFICYNRQLWSYLSPLGKAPEKQVPAFVKESSPDDIRTFLNWFTLGDGTLMRHGFRIFYTSSKTLADDMQELLLKIGRVGLVKSRNRGGKRWIVNHYADASRTQYEVIERVKKINSRLDGRDISIVDYNGIVYCAAVKNHVMYVRRNGKPFWCGNTSMYWTRSNPVFEQTLLKMREKLGESGYVGYIDINCIANARGIWPLEFTSRFGYPTISIQMEGVTSELGQFFYELAHGTGMQLKTKKGYQVGVIIAIPPFPFEDQKAFKKYSEGAAILFKRAALDGVHIGEVKKVRDDWYIAGQSGYALIITGSGGTMADAIKNSYQRIGNVMIPNMFYRSDIGQRWSRDSDMLLSWGYL